jgi:signal transduction histidine kinase
VKSNYIFPHIPSQTVYERVYAAALKLLYQHTPEKTYATIVKEAMKLVGAKYGSLFLFPQGDVIRAYASHDSLYQITPRKKGHTWNVYSVQKPYILHFKKLKSLHPEIAKLHIGTDIGVPLSYNDKPFGVLSVMSSEEIDFTQEQLLILQLFSPLASLSLRNTQLYTEVKTSLQEQDLFISMAAHELKTPLTSISIYSQLLLREDVENNKVTMQSKEKMFHEIQRLSKLVNELMQISQIKKGRLQFDMKKCNLNNIIEVAVTNFQNGDNKHKFRFKNLLGENAVFIKGDADKLTQVITNLLTNASKFSKNNSFIDITISRENTRNVIKVRDYGIGIDEKDLPRIFEGFYKASFATKEGLGLGLFLVKNIVDAHKGTIIVKSKKDKGTTFVISLPSYGNIT